jgi:hypothetical protein
MGSETSVTTVSNAFCYLIDYTGLRPSSY